MAEHMSDFEDNDAVAGEVTANEPNTTPQQLRLVDVDQLIVCFLLAMHRLGKREMIMVPPPEILRNIAEALREPYFNTPTQLLATDTQCPQARKRATRRILFPLPNMMNNLKKPRQENVELLRQLLEEVGKQVDLFPPLTASCKPPSFGRPPHEDEDDAPGHGHGLFTPLGLPIM